MWGPGLHARWERSGLGVCGRSRRRFRGGGGQKGKKSLGYWCGACEVRTGSRKKVRGKPHIRLEEKVFCGYSKKDKAKLWE